MAFYVCKILKNGKARFLNLPTALCRGLQIVAGDTLILEPQIDGSVALIPPKLQPKLLENIKSRTMAERKLNG